MHLQPLPSRLAWPRLGRLESDEDVASLLQERFPLIDDPAARAAIVARFGHRRRRSMRSVMLAAVAMILLAVLSWFGVRWVTRQGSGRRTAVGGGAGL